MSEASRQSLARHAGRFFGWVLAGYLLAGVLGLVWVRLLPPGPPWPVVLWVVALGVPFGVGIKFGHQAGRRHGLCPHAAGLVGLGGMGLYVLAHTVGELLGIVTEADAADSGLWWYSLMRGAAQVAVAAASSAGGAWCAFRQERARDGASR